MRAEPEWDGLEAAGLLGFFDPLRDDRLEELVLGGLLLGHVQADVGLGLFLGGETSGMVKLTLWAIMTFWRSTWA